MMNILKYPYRVRQYILHSQKNCSIKLKSNSNSNSSSNLSSPEMGNYLIKKPEKYNARVMKYLGSVIPEYHQQTVENLYNTVVMKPIQENLHISNTLHLQDNVSRTGAVRNVNYYPSQILSSQILSSKILLPMEGIVSWEMVTDENLEKILQNENNLIEEMQGQDDGNINVRGGKELCGRKRNILVESVKNLKKYCGLNIIHNSDTPHTSSTNISVDVDVRDGDKLWSLLGISMISEFVLSSCSDKSHQNRSNNLIPRVYSPQYIWHAFYPFLFPLLRSTLLATTEGLRLAQHLGRITAFILCSISMFCGDPYFVENRPNS